MHSASEANQTIEKEKIQKKEKKEKKEKEFVSVVLDKMCVFCLYSISDSQ